MLIVRNKKTAAAAGLTLEANGVIIDDTAFQTSFSDTYTPAASGNDIIIGIVAVSTTIGALTGFTSITWRGVDISSDQIRANTVGGQRPQLVEWYKVSAGSGAGTLALTFNTNCSAVVAYAFEYAGLAAAPLVQSALNNTTATDATTLTQALTGTVAGNRVASMMAITSDAGGITPDSMTELDEVVTGTDAFSDLSSSIQEGAAGGTLTAGGTWVNGQQALIDVIELEAA